MTGATRATRRYLDAPRRWGLSGLAVVSNPAAIFVAWFVAALACVLWVWGLNPLTFPSPDEALNRLAAKVIAERGNPFLHLPFPDPEDLAHPRFWISLGDYAVPAYAPVALYVYALLTKIPRVGMLLVAALPASGAAAFAAGTALLLPKGRRWLGLLSPLLGFPGLYWLLRPWVNMSPLLLCLGWALLAWASWRQSGSWRWFAAALLFVGAGAAVRPDYAAYLLLPALLLSIGASPADWKRIAIVVCAAGVGAVVLNLILNKLITGHALRAAYQLLIDREDEGSAGSGPALPRLPGMLGPLLLPMGLPPLHVVTTLFVKYWVKMGPIGGLLFGQLALIPLLVAATRRQRAFYGAALVVIVGFVVSRMSDGVFGAKVTEALVHHSTPRYWAPVYLFATLPPLLLLGRASHRAVLALGAALVCALAGFDAHAIYVGQNASLTYLRNLAVRNERQLVKLHTKIPKGAVVYTTTQDKVLWSGWHVCMMREPEPTAASMERALDASLRVYAMEPGFGGARLGPLAKALQKRSLALSKVDAGQGLYRLERRPAGG